MADRRARARTWPRPRSREAPPTPPTRPSAQQAADRLQRLLYVIPRASGPEGVALSELADELGTDVNTVLADLREVQERDLYQPTGGGDDFQIWEEEGRVGVWTARDHSRPPKLTTPEALALWLGLEIGRVSVAPTLDDQALRDRLRAHLVQAPDRALDPAVAAPSITDDPGLLRHTLASAAAERRRCVIEYAKPGAEAPEERLIRPYSVVHAEGAWYVLGHCERSEDVRAFRLDRTLGAYIREGCFEQPPDFDPADYLDLDGGRVFRPDDCTEATVRYSREVARWVAECEHGDWQEDGSFIVRHSVADPDWLARHVLGYAGDAEVVDPPELRTAVLEVARRLARRGH